MIRYADASTRARILDAVHHSLVGSLNLELDENLKPGTAEVIDRNGRTSIDFKTTAPQPERESEQQQVGSAEACTNDEDLLDLPKGMQ